MTTNKGCTADGRDEHGYNRGRSDYVLQRSVQEIVDCHKYKGIVLFGITEL